MAQKRNPHSVRSVKCAVCGKVRQEVNHWFVVRTVCFFVCWPFSESEEAELEPDERPVCGQGCAQKEFECWMTEKRNAPSETPIPESGRGPYRNFEL